MTPAPSGCWRGVCAVVERRGGGGGGPCLGEREKKRVRAPRRGKGLSAATAPARVGAPFRPPVPFLATPGTRHAACATKFGVATPTRHPGRGLHAGPPHPKKKGGRAIRCHKPHHSSSPPPSLPPAPFPPGAKAYDLLPTTVPGRAEQDPATWLDGGYAAARDAVGALAAVEDRIDMLTRRSLLLTNAATGFIKRHAPVDTDDVGA